MFLKKRILAMLTASICTFSLLSVPLSVRADSVTDTLSVCVGYYGMDLSDYVTVNTYHWSELEQALPIYEEAYSYYSKGTFDNEYTAVVVAAHGFLVSDLLSYSNIYYGDIYNILFYVVDAQGIWTAFDRDSLFKNRYYFNDLAGHRTIIYGTKQQQVQQGDETVIEEVPDYTKIKGYTFEQAWDDCKTVEPMLSLEDNWVSFSEEFEHIGPDFSYMSTGGRFRLLFGQTDPTESMTRESAKYVSRVYVTLNGAPSIGQMPEEIDGSLGSHEVTLTITDVYNKDMRDTLSEYLNLDSTNEDVLRIDNIRIEATEYSDVANVIVSYSIIGEGEASLTASVGSLELKDAGGTTLSQLTTVQTGGSGSGEEGGQEGGTSDPTNSDKPSSDGQQNTSGQDQAGNDDSNDSGNLTEHSASADPAEENKPEETVNLNGEEPETQELANVVDQAMAYALTGDVLQQLAMLNETVPSETKADQNITEVKVDDPKTNEMYLILIGWGMLGVIVIGGITGYTSYRIRLKKSFRYLFHQKKTPEN